MNRKPLFLLVFCLLAMEALGLGSQSIDSATAEVDPVLRDLAESYETLQSDPTGLHRIEDRIVTEESFTESELRKIDQTIGKIQESIDRAKKRQEELRSLLETLLAGPAGVEEKGAHANLQNAGSDEEWWAIQPLKNPEVPSTANDTWSTNSIDEFVLRRLNEKNMKPAPEASREQLLRRVYFDLIGLPPTPREIQDFLNDSSPEAWEHLVDRLLADPRYGEHWAQFWLDLVRYAESDGWNKDSFRPHIWRYRDYVVDSFNSDKPYPEFVREQLAGDEIPGDRPDNRIATGFLRLGIYEYNQRDARNHWNDIMNEITDVAGDVFLGVSMSCSRCHNHKFDPISQTDYFGLRAFFEPLTWRDDLPGASDSDQQTWNNQQEIWEAATVEIRTKIDALCEPFYQKKWESTVDKFPLDIQACFHKPVEERSSWEQQMVYLIERQFEEEGTPALKSLSEEDKKQLEALEARLAEFNHLKLEPLPVVMSITDFDGSISPTTIPKDRRETPISPKFLTVLSTHSPEAAALQPDLPKSTGRRTALAKWIGDRNNPLTTRLIVNRIWQQHFGRGIVPTASDFGHLGQPPTHPDLLDWLTVNFIDNGWRMKYLHKTILMSSTWRQSSHHPDAPSQLKIDPSENLIWRGRARRLKAEEIRDSMLLVSGEMDRRVGGPSLKPDSPRRSLYVKRLRNSPNPLLQSFDTANGLASVAQRNHTTTPTQALLMFNGDYTLDRAMALAMRIQQLKSETPEEALDFLFQLVWNRRATPNERSKAISYVMLSKDEGSQDIVGGRLVDLCHVLMNSNEFLYVD